MNEGGRHITIIEKTEMIQALGGKLDLMYIFIVGSRNNYLHNGEISQAFQHGLPLLVLGVG
jgi:hypothetical protein